MYIFQTGLNIYNFFFLIFGLKLIFCLDIHEKEFHFTLFWLYFKIVSNENRLWKLILGTSTGGNPGETISYINFTGVL